MNTNQTLVDRCRDKNLGFKRGAPHITVPLEAPKPLNIVVRHESFIILHVKDADGIERDFQIKMQQARDLRDSITATLDDTIKPTAIIRFTVARFYGMILSDLDSDRRTERIVWPRWVAMYFIRHMLPKQSLNNIAQLFGGFDHGAVLHGIKRIKERSDTEPAFRDELKTIETKIREALEEKK
jgi:chromosomal replication initiator protein